MFPTRSANRRCGSPPPEPDANRITDKKLAQVATDFAEQSILNQIKPNKRASFECEKPPPLRKKAAAFQLLKQLFSFDPD
jgi:hypothetical protein